MEQGIETTLSDYKGLLRGKPKRQPKCLDRIQESNEKGWL
jgi:hypothetical protein